MKNIKRLVFGIVSSLLLAAGFARAADQLDPVVVDASVAASQSLGVADDCSLPCDDATDLN